MAALYIDVVPCCGECGSSGLWRLDRAYGIHSASIWTCVNADCPNYCQRLIVPLVKIDALTAGRCSDEEIRQWNPNHNKEQT